MSIVCTLMKEITYGNDYITVTLKFLKVTLSIIIYVFIFIINHILRTVLKININL